MTITRLRAYPDADTLARMYPQPHNHQVFPDHLRRVERTIVMGTQLAQHVISSQQRPVHVADLSCGDAAIAKGIAGNFDPGLVLLYLGDFAPGHPVTGPIEQTLNDLDKVDVFVCCETLEHVEHPLKLLRQIRKRTTLLLLSTPVDNWGDDNPEHIWSYSATDVEELMATAGFIAHKYENLDMRPEGYPYSWGIWGAS